MENYFNYFTEIEECFRKCRGTPTLLSTVDWALIESWKEAGLPLEAVLDGIKRTFEKHSRRAPRFQRVNGLAFCTQQVMKAWEEHQLNAQQAGTARKAVRPEADAPFSAAEVQAYLNHLAKALGTSAASAEQGKYVAIAEDFRQAAAAVLEMANGVASAPHMDYEALERALTVREEKVMAALQRGLPDALLMMIRDQAERALAGSRQRMPPAQIDLVMRQMNKKLLFEMFKIPRLSLFHMMP